MCLCATWLRTQTHAHIRVRVWPCVRLGFAHTAIHAHVLLLDGCHVCVSQEAKKKALEDEKKKLNDLREAAEKRAQAAERRQEEAAERQVASLANDSAKLNVLNRCAETMQSLSDSLLQKRLPAQLELPPLEEWLATKGLSEVGSALEEWDLRLLLESADEVPLAEFDADFAEEIPSKPKRRKLFHALRQEFALHAK